MKKLRRVVVLFLATFLCLQGGVVANAQSSGSPTYTYDVHADPVELRTAYEVSRIIDGESLGVGRFSDINALYVKDDLMYICDSANNRIVVLDCDYQSVEVIDTFTDEDGQEDSLKYPTDIAVASNGDRYIADSQNNRIVVLDEDGELQAIVDSVDSEILGENFVFTPTKLELDSADNLYVTAKGVTQGIMDMNLDGTVNSFLGAAKVDFDLGLYLQKLFFTEEQAAQLSRIVPTEYNNLYIGEDDFIYGTVNTPDPTKLESHIKASLYHADGVDISTINESLVKKIERMFTVSINQSGQNDMVKKINMKGDDILKRTGYHAIAGDLEYEIIKTAVGESDATKARITTNGPSQFVDMVVHPNGSYSVLDQTRGRIFTYDSYGVLLYAFGGTGNADGQFSKVSSIELFQGQLAVSDSVRNTITLFAPTEFAQTVDQAMLDYSTGYYEDALANWQKSVSLCSNFEVGYMGAGRSLLRMKDYEGAMEYFKLAEYREGYAQAFDHYRTEQLRGPWGVAICVVIVLLIVLYMVWIFIRKRKKRAQKS